MNVCIRFGFLLCTAAMLAVAFVPRVVMAQACISLDVQVGSQGLSVPRTVVEGEDYATNILKDAWDFTEGRDFGFESDFQVPTITAGVWSAFNVTENKPGKVFPLFSGVEGKNSFQPLPEDLNLPKSGANLSNQIDTDKYNYLSFRSKHQSLNKFGLQWKINDLSDDTTRVVVPPDAIEGTDPAFPDFFRGTGWNIFGVDFVDLEMDWVDFVSELALVPSTVGSFAGKRTDFDWIRLVDPTSAPELTFNVFALFSVSTCQSNSSANIFYTIFADGDGEINNTEDTPIFRGKVDHSGGSSYSVALTFPSAALPPGAYRFYADIRDSSNLVLKDINNANISTANPQLPILTIARRPQVVVTAPAPNGTTSYDDVVVGNAWEMDAATDIANLDATLYTASERNFKNQQLLTAGGVTFFRAETSNSVTRPRPLGPVDNGFEAKAGAHLDLATSPFDPIIPAEYRYLVFRARGAQASNGNKYLRLDRKQLHNWYAQAVFWNSKNEFNYGWTKEQFLYEGWNTYVIDLWDFEEQDGKPWLAYNRISNLSLQPMNSSDTSVGFDVDFVKLYKENVATAQTYQIKYKIIDPGGTGPYKVNFFYDTINALFNASVAVPIGSETFNSQGEKTFTWNIPEDLSGEYYVYVQIVNAGGDEISGSYSTVPVVVGERETFVQPSALDFDADGKSDNSVYRPTTGHSFQRRSASESVFIPWVTGDQYHPLAGDFDGDGVTDLGFVFEYAGWLGWYIFKSDESLPLTERLYFRVWGKPGDSIVVGDYLGLDKEQIAVYRDGEWYVLDENDGAYVFAWGVPGDVPVPGDFDGDLILDLAIWRPTTGEWWVAESETGDVQVQQWGLDGDIPLVGDWSGDGISDFGIYRPNGSLWAVMENEDHDDNGVIDGLSEIVQWGLAGDMPVVGDFNGDGHADFTVYRPETGMWFHNFRNKKKAAVQYGLPGDRVPGVIKATVAP